MARNAVGRTAWAIEFRTIEANPMKKLLLTLCLLTAIGIQTHAQGTIQFNNSVLTRFARIEPGGGASVPMDIPFNVAVYFAETPGAWQGPVLPLGRSLSGSTSTGVFTAPYPFQIPGTESLQTVDMLIYAWTAQDGDDPYQAWRAGAWTTSTDVRQVTLLQTSGPGQVIWQGLSGTNPNRFHAPKFGPGSPPPPVVPEPSTLALWAIGSLVLLLCWHKSVRRHQRP